MSIAVSSSTVSSNTKNLTAPEDDGRPCTIHPDWCAESGVHDDHIGAAHVVLGNDGSELLDARLLDFSGSNPIIGLGETDTDAAGARAKAKELRKFADDLEILANAIDASTSDEKPSTRNTASCPDGVPFCTGDPADHEDPTERFHHGPSIAMGAHRHYAGRHGDGIMTFHLSQVNDEAPGLAFVAGGDWPTLTLEEVDELISDMSAHLVKLRAARTQMADLITRRLGPTATAPVRTWTYASRSGTRYTITCPSWCTTDHTHDMELTSAPCDVHHQLYGADARAEYTEAYEEYESRPLLCAHLAVSPDSTVSPAYRVPHVAVEVTADTWTRPMGPDQLTEFIDTVAGQLEELRAMQPRLTAARADWTAQADTRVHAEAA
ncbi:DUF6907 domain-containing protein [Streptomyces sp. NPDC002285]